MGLEAEERMERRERLRTDWCYWQLRWGLGTTQTMSVQPTPKWNSCQLHFTSTTVSTVLPPLYSSILFSLSFLITIGVHTSGNNTTLFFTLWVITCFLNQHQVTAQDLHTKNLLLIWWKVRLISQCFIRFFSSCFMRAASQKSPVFTCFPCPDTIVFWMEACSPSLIFFTSTQCIGTFTVVADLWNNYLQWQQCHISVGFISL